ncbi:MAG: hypothetical protein RBS87_06160 [Acholeplasma sp.]|nr:hypothetical protein [Acholeplasma sp.]
MKKLLFLIGYILSFTLTVAIFIHFWVLFFMTGSHNHFIANLMLFVFIGILALMGHYETKDKSYDSFTALRIAFMYWLPVGGLAYFWYLLDFKGTIFYYTYTLIILFNSLLHFITAIVPLSDTTKKSLNQ